MERVSSSQLGLNIFDSCLRFAELLCIQGNVSSLIFKGKDGKNQRSVKESTKFREMLLVYMWAVFDLLNANPKYEKTTHSLFGGYVNFLGLMGKEAKEEMQFLEKRFHEYKNLFRKDENMDPTYLVVALVMSENITGAMNPLFASQLVTGIQEFVIMWNKQLDRIEIV